MRPKRKRHKGKEMGVLKRDILKQLQRSERDRVWRRNSENTFLTGESLKTTQGRGGPTWRPFYLVSDTAGLSCYALSSRGPASKLRWLPGRPGCRRTALGGGKRSARL